MSLGNVIRKYRKQKHMTQEEMAVRLGVTAPAVNKWEKGNSCPDITLLAPIARLLGISLDTLLSFREELTEEEIRQIVCDADLKLRELPYEEAFQWAKRKLEEYPNCEQLTWQIAVIFDAQRIIQKVDDPQQYDDYLCSLFARGLESEDEKVRNQSADSLFGFYMRKEQYEKAEEYLEYFSIQNPERKRKQAWIYSETNRIGEAYQAYEELLYSYYPMISLALDGIYRLALKENNLEKAHRIADKQEEMAKCFEMGRYQQVCKKLEIATMEKDEDLVIETMTELLNSIDEIGSCAGSFLYEHMKWGSVRKEFLEELKGKLLEGFGDEEQFGFLKENERWRELVK